MNHNINHDRSDPIFRCVSCEKLGANCDGPNFLAMGAEKWAEWCYRRKQALAWTNAQIAERANISKVSVDRIMSGDTKDIRTSTMKAVTEALINGKWLDRTCSLDADGGVARAQLDMLQKQAKKSDSLLKVVAAISVVSAATQIALQLIG